MNNKLHHVVIIGGGFGGLYTTKSLKRAPVKITLIDKRNFHLFQPLLYQVATGGLSPGDIASPLRAGLAKQKNITVLNAEVTDIDAERQTAMVRDGEINYDVVFNATIALDGSCDDTPGSMELVLDLDTAWTQQVEVTARDFHGVYPTSGDNAVIITLPLIEGATASIGEGAEVVLHLIQ